MKLKLESMLGKIKQYRRLGNVFSSQNTYTHPTETDHAQTPAPSAWDDDPDFWETLFAKAHPGLYGSFRKISEAFVGENALVIMPSQYREPQFWRDLYTDILSIRGLPDNGKLLRVIEKLLNGQKLDKGKKRGEIALLCRLFDSFWTLLVVLENHEDAGKILLPLVLEDSPSFLVYANDKAVKKLAYALETGEIPLWHMRNDSLMLILQDERMAPSVCTREKMLVFSSYKGYPKIVQLLLDDPKVDPGCEYQGRKNAALLEAVRKGNTDIVRLLLVDGRADPTAEDNHCVEMAAAEGHAGVLRLLLDDSRVDPAARDNSAIREASSRGHTGALRILMKDARVDVQKVALETASKNEHLETVRLILRDGRVDPSRKRNRATRWASVNGRTKMTRLLLEDPRVELTAEENTEIMGARLRKMGM